MCSKVTENGKFNMKDAAGHSVTNYSLKIYLVFVSKERPGVYQQILNNIYLTFGLMPLSTIDTLLPVHNIIACYRAYGSLKFYVVLIFILVSKE